MWVVNSSLEGLLWLKKNLLFTFQSEINDNHCNWYAIYVVIWEWDGKNSTRWGEFLQGILRIFQFNEEMQYLNAYIFCVCVCINLKTFLLCFGKLGQYCLKSGKLAFKNAKLPIMLTSRICWTQSSCGFSVSVWFIHTYIFLFDYI